MAEKKLSLDGFETEKFKKPKTPKKKGKGPKLKTWLVWITFFVLGVGFLAFGNVKFYTKQKVKKVDSVPVWTQEIVETVTTTFKSDSNNLNETGGYLNYYTLPAVSVFGDALKDYDIVGNYYGDVDFGSNYAANLRIFFMYNSKYFENFAPEGSSLDRSVSYFNYYIEKGSNLIVTVDNYMSSGLTSFDFTPGLIHSIPYSLISRSGQQLGSSLRLRLEKIDYLNDDPEDNKFRLYPSVDLVFTKTDFYRELKSYTVFEVEEKITKKSEMVLEYQERVTYYDEFKFNLNGAQFNEVATGLFDNVTGYISKFLNMFNTVFEFLQSIFKAFIKYIGGILGKILDLFS